MSRTTEHRCALRPITTAHYDGHELSGHDWSEVIREGESLGAFSARGSRYYVIPKGMSGPAPSLILPSEEKVLHVLTQLAGA